MTVRSADLEAEINFNVTGGHLYCNLNYMPLTDRPVQHGHEIFALKYKIAILWKLHQWAISDLSVTSLFIRVCVIKLIRKMLVSEGFKYELSVCV